MFMKNQNFYAVNDEGEIVNCDILFTFENEDQDNIIVFTDGSEEDGNVQVFANIAKLATIDESVFPNINLMYSTINLAITNMVSQDEVIEVFNSFFKIDKDKMWFENDNHFVMKDEDKEIAECDIVFQFVKFGRHFFVFKHGDKDHYQFSIAQMCLYSLEDDEWQQVEKTLLLLQFAMKKGMSSDEIEAFIICSQDYSLDEIKRKIARYESMRNSDQ